MDSGNLVMDYLVRAFELGYPYEYERAIDIIEYDAGLARIVLNDGTIGFFDNIDFMFKIVYRDGDTFEDAWKEVFAILLDYRMGMMCVGQVRLSELTGISQATLSGYFNCKYVPTVINVMKLAKALHVQNSYFTDCLMDIL